LELDPITYGLLTAEMARGCSSVRSLLTVHDMVSLTVARWAKEAVKERYLGDLATGRLLAALALSEPEVGSDAARARTTARRDGDCFLLDGCKKWITFGQIADLFLVLAQLDGQPTAFLVPADAPGLCRIPNEVVMGTRASRLAEVHFDSCQVPEDHLLGRPGFGFSHVVTHALDHGRYSVAWGAVGVAEACLEACRSYTSSREQGGKLLRDHQLVRRLLTNMIADSRAARLLCYRAGSLRRSRDPGAAAETMIAKYFTSRVATRCANDAVQLHGANGMTELYPVARLLRDAKVLEIIEGSSQIQQITIPELPVDEL
jgi:alkylation response protein AidB-like acyl-CoA dehydrogenase